MSGPRRLYPGPRAKTAGLAVYSGSFVTAGTNAPSVIHGSGFTVSAPSSGVYTITITDGPWLEDHYAHANVSVATANSTAGARIGTIGTDGTFTIITSSAAGTDAALTGPIVHFRLIVKTTAAR